MSKKQEKAMELFKEGYNCSQAVLLAFSDELGMDKETATKAAAAFGGGMSRLREVCGAVSGMMFVSGMMNASVDPKDANAKSELYAKSQELAKAFEQENGSIICRELLGLTEKRQEPTPEVRTAEYYKKRPCVELVGCAAKILEDLL